MGGLFQPLLPVHHPHFVAKIQRQRLAEAGARQHRLCRETVQESGSPVCVARSGAHQRHRPVLRGVCAGAERHAYRHHDDQVPHAGHAVHGQTGEENHRQSPAIPCALHQPAG